MYSQHISLFPIQYNYALSTHQPVPYTIQLCTLNTSACSQYNIIMYSQHISLFPKPCSLLFVTYFVIYSFCKLLFSFPLLAINYNLVLNLNNYFCKCYSLRMRTESLSRKLWRGYLSS